MFSWAHHQRSHHPLAQPVGFIEKSHPKVIPFHQGFSALPRRAYHECPSCGHSWGNQKGRSHATQVIPKECDGICCSKPKGRKGQSDQNSSHTHIYIFLSFFGLLQSKSQVDLIRPLCPNGMVADE
jgi:hypothetical protein